MNVLSQAAGEYATYYQPPDEFTIGYHSFIFLFPCETPVPELKGATQRALS
jgi:hypothetical protein